MEKIDSKENIVRMINQYQNLIFSICLKLTGDYFAAEDLTQETFLSAYCHLDDINEQMEKAWLCRVASNKCVDYSRAAVRRTIPAQEEELHNMEADSRDGPLSKILNQEVMEELRACCETLPPTYKEVARQHFLEGKTVKEIAELSDLSLSTVKTKVYRARELLKKSFRKELLQE